MLKFAGYGREVYRRYFKLNVDVLWSKCFMLLWRLLWTIPVEDKNVHFIATLILFRLLWPVYYHSSFLIQVYLGFKFCPSFLETVGLRVPTRYLRDFPLFNFGSSITNCPSATCASPTNVACRDSDTFKQKMFMSVKFYYHSTFQLFRYLFFSI
jgi:hypothetical protein